MRKSVLRIPIITEWAPFTPVTTFTTNVTNTGRWRRLGDILECQVLQVFSGGTSSAAYTITLPFGLSIDQSKIISTTNKQTVLGYGSYNDASEVQGAAELMGLVRMNSSTTVALFVLDNDATIYTLSQIDNSTPFPVAVATGDIIKCFFSVPIAGWSAYRRGR